MPKITLQNLANLDNPNSAVSTINLNFQTIQEIVDTLLSRDGLAPNAMLSILDMNNYRVINLPPPTSPSEPARHGDIQQYVDQAQDYAEDAAESAGEAAVSAAAALVSEQEAEAALEDFLSRYLGAFDTAPEAEINGAIYFDTNTNQWMVWTINDVVAGVDNVVAGSDNVLSSYWIAFPQATLRSLTDVDAGGMTTGQFLVWNNGTETFTPEDLTAENVSFDPDGTMFNGSDVQTALEEVSDRTSLGVYDIAFWLEGLMENNEVLYRIVSVRDFSIPVGVPGAVAVSGVAANSETVISLRKNGVQFGTVTFEASSDTGVFTVPGTVTFTSGDTLEVRAPSSADTTLRDTAITLTARR